MRMAPLSGGRAAAVLLLVVVLAAGCSDSGPARHSVISTGPDGLRTFTVITEIDGNPVVCPAFGLTDPVVGILRGELGGRPEPVWLEGAGGSHLSVVWPGGFTVRFDPAAALVNEHGSVVARAGETVTLGQIRPADHAGTFDDPYLASGIVFDNCYPFTP
jgi:hypothetical protein